MQVLLHQSHSDSSNDLDKDCILKLTVLGVARKIRPTNQKANYHDTPTNTFSIERENIPNFQSQSRLIWS